MLVLSLIEFCIHGVLLGLAGYYVFNQLAEQLGSFSFDIDVSGISVSVGSELFGDLNVFETIYLVIQLVVMIPLALGTVTGLLGMFGFCCKYVFFIIYP